MKTPKEWLSDYYSADNLESLVAEIQKDAFSAGWKQGMRDAQDMLSKGINLERAISAFPKPPLDQPTPQCKAEGA